MENVFVKTTIWYGGFVKRTFSPFIRWGHLGMGVLRQILISVRQEKNDMSWEQ